MTHNQICQLVKNAGNNLKMVIERWVKNKQAVGSDISNYKTKYFDEFKINLHPIHLVFDILSRVISSADNPTSAHISYLLFQKILQSVD